MNKLTNMKFIVENALYVLLSFRLHCQLFSIILMNARRLS